MNIQKVSKSIALKTAHLDQQYNPECDMFEEFTQINITDMRLLNIIREQQVIIEELTARLCALEVFTGMTAPAPLPVDDGMSVTFAAGSVDYTDKPETAQTDENGDLPY